MSSTNEDNVEQTSHQTLRIKNRMKASFRDKYIEICENTMQRPDDKYLVKGTLLSHLKLNVCPIIGSGDKRTSSIFSSTTEQKSEVSKSTKDENNNSKTTLKKRNSSTSPLQRKKCFRRNSDQRSRAEKARSMDVYSRKIANDNDDNTKNAFSSNTMGSPSSRTSSLHLATSDGCFIPEEIKQQILKARHDCMLAKQRMLNDQTSSSLSSSSTSPNNSNTNSLSRDNSNSNELGTFINVSYRNSRRELVVEQKGSVHSYAPHPPPPLRGSHFNLYRMSSDGRDAMDDAYNSSGSSTEESDYDEVENPYSFVANDVVDGAAENPYSTVLDAYQSHNNSKSNNNMKRNSEDSPFYYVLDKDVCHKQGGIDSLGCALEFGEDDSNEHIYSEPSICSSDSNSLDAEQPATGVETSMLPEQYLVKTSISQQDSNASTGSCTSLLDTGDDGVLVNTSEPFYHVLEDIVTGDGNISEDGGDACIQRRPRSALSNIKEDDCEDDELDTVSAEGVEVFV